MSPLQKGEIKRRIFEVMEQAYLEASDDRRLPAVARQVGYAARRLSGLGDRLSLDYFLKRLLNEYLDAHPEQTAEWDVVRDDRGTFTEPHTGLRVPLGTIAVRDYLGHPGHELRDEEPPEFGLAYPTHGPKDRFGSILYIEKEGFNELIAADRVQERWDIAVASCKGYSVRAARRLVAELHSRHDVPVLVVHDFDKQGIGIFDTLGSGDHVIDLGLRLGDIEDERWGLASQAESVNYGQANPRPNLSERGATPAEIAFLCRTETPPLHGRRVELNALVGRTFIDWLEAKLEAEGVKKIVPDADTLERAYRNAYRLELINRAIAEAFEEADGEASSVAVPDDLVTWVTDALDDDRTTTWDGAIVGRVLDEMEP